jgi:hypothetical protein
MDNPSKPPKCFRDKLTQRSKAEKKQLEERMTPVLLEEWAKYKENLGKAPLGADSAKKLNQQLGDALDRALNGVAPDFDALDCASCAFKTAEAARCKIAAEKGEVRETRPAIEPRDCARDCARSTRASRAELKAQELTSLMSCCRRTDVVLPSHCPHLALLFSSRVWTGAREAVLQRHAPPLLLAQ